MPAIESRGRDGVDPGGNRFAATGSRDHEDGFARRNSARLGIARSARGDDQGLGTADKPFVSLERARDEIRTIRRKGPLPRGGARVLVHGGEYTVSKTLVLTADDSGNESEPVRYSAAPGEKVLFRGGVHLNGWKPLTDARPYPLLPRKSIGKVWYLDLKNAGITKPMPLKLGGFGSGNGFATHPAHELFFNGKALQIARGPNEGFLNIADVVVKDGTKGYDRTGSKAGIFTYTGIFHGNGRPSRTCYYMGIGSGTGPIPTSAWPASTRRNG